MEWEGSSPYSPEFKSRFSFHLTLAPSGVSHNEFLDCLYIMVIETVKLVEIIDSKYTYRATCNDSFIPENRSVNNINNV